MLICLLYLTTYCFIIAATGDVKLSSSSGDRVIADLLIEGNPVQSAFKSKCVNHYNYLSCNVRQCWRQH